MQIISKKLKKRILTKRISLFSLSLVILLGSFGVVLNATNSLNNVPTVKAESCLDVYDSLPSWVVSRVNENKATYIQVANETGVPWEVLAAIHYREFNLRRDVNPENGQGIYQMYSIYQSDTSYRALAQAKTVTAENFLNQTRYAANFIQNKAQYTTGTPFVTPRKLTKNETSINLIKSTFFSYNGRAAVYAAQATKYGFSSTNQPYEGSPYVMNKFDCARSGMGISTSDGSGTLTGTDTRLGAFTLYARLKGDSYWLGLFKNPPADCNEKKVDCVWEFVNEDTGRYFYTSSKTERDAVYKMNYRPVGISFHIRKTADKKTVNVYRLYNNKLGWHFWTTSEAEKASLLKNSDWNDEGVGYKVDPSSSNTGDPVRRLYNPTLGIHRLTSNSTTVKSLLSQGYLNEGVQFVSVSTNYQASIPNEGYENVYRFLLKDGRHFWTSSVSERNALLNAGEKFEGIAWESPLAGEPIYRTYSSDGKHFWTKSLDEFKSLIKSGWRDEGTVWSSRNQTSGQVVYRLYNIKNGNHLFTSSSQEKSTVLSNSEWRYEGVSWLN